MSDAITLSWLAVFSDLSQTDHVRNTRGCPPRNLAFLEKQVNSMVVTGHHTVLWFRNTTHRRWYCQLCEFHQILTSPMCTPIPDQLLLVYGFGIICCQLLCKLVFWKSCEDGASPKIQLAIKLIGLQLLFLGRLYGRWWYLLLLVISFVPSQKLRNERRGFPVLSLYLPFHGNSQKFTTDTPLKGRRQFPISHKLCLR